MKKRIRAHKAGSIEADSRKAKRWCSRWPRNRRSRTCKQKDKQIDDQSIWEGPATPERAKTEPTSSINQSKASSERS